MLSYLCHRFPILSLVCRFSSTFITHIETYFELKHQGLTKVLRRRGFDWIPGEDNIRPTPETREKKVKWLESVMSKYVGRRDFVLHDLFRCETRRNEKGLMLVDEASLKRVGKNP